MKTGSAQASMNSPRFIKLRSGGSPRLRLFTFIFRSSPWDAAAVIFPLFSTAEKLAVGRRLKAC